MTTASAVALVGLVVRETQSHVRRRATLLVRIIKGLQFQPLCLGNGGDFVDCIRACGTTTVLRGGSGIWFLFLIAVLVWGAHWVENGVVVNFALA
eukprot:CAMPEP_0168748986 /NCGR_PEP_ID=MMETSP0724-20121128/16465_1 /TAXON_ID=265536 /ORGANISM="Amphiprora sp., Strain CCMP467" /LENGTH=94 /DNA_ID=CAMNT_0008796845 /DNA_START=112 /DNA_END=396 /DNA_ORIENTATION=+